MAENTRETVNVVQGTGECPHYQISRFNLDNFVVNQLTVVLPGSTTLPKPAAPATPDIPLTPPAAGREPVLSIDEIKLHCRIELDQNYEDKLLEQYEMAAHLMTEQYLRRPGELGKTAPEHVKQAMLVLCAHWYRNREAVGNEKMAELPLAYCALLSTEVEYSWFY